MRQVVVIPGKPGGEYFANDFSGLGLSLAEAALDTGTREPGLGSPRPAKRPGNIQTPLNLKNKERNRIKEKIGSLSGSGRQP